MLSAIRAEEGAPRFRVIAEKTYCRSAIDLPVLLSKWTHSAIRAEEGAHRFRAIVEQIYCRSTIDLPLLFSK